MAWWLLSSLAALMASSQGIFMDDERVSMLQTENFLRAKEVDSHIDLEPLLTDSGQFLYDAVAAFDVLSISRDQAFGLLLAVTASVLIGASFPLKKLGLDRANEKQGTRACLGGYGFLQEPVWWLGISLMISGEGLNSVAYAYAPAVFVTPMGALSIVCSGVFARFLLGETLTCTGWQGSLLCIFGCLVIVLSAPVEHKMTSVEEIIAGVEHPAFIIYAICTLSLAFGLASIAQVRSREEHSLPLLVSICSLVGSMSVMAVRSLSMSVRIAFEGQGDLEGLTHALAFPLVLVALIALFMAIQITFLNRALDAFNSVTVCPVYYAMFTILTLVANFVSTKEWVNIRMRHTVLVVLGLAIITVGVSLMVQGSGFHSKEKDTACLMDNKEKEIQTT